MKTAVAIRHVHFEDLGSFEAVLAAAGYRVHYYDIGVHELWTLDPRRSELLIALGGPIGVNDGNRYPFLSEERDLLSARLQAGLPTFGICLGAQLMAAALSAAVTASTSKEIGYSPITLTRDGENSPLRHLADVPVLHWHGDTFDIPVGASRLAFTHVCGQQAFAHGPNIMGVQFHPEAALGADIERWLVGHSVELAAANIDPRALREDAVRHGSALREAGQEMFAEWLSQLQR